MTSPVLPRRTRRAIVLTLAGLWAEQLVRSLWPLAALCWVVMGAALISDPALWPVEVLWISTSFALATGGFGLWYAVTQFQIPRRAMAVARVDRTLSGRPLQALTDTQATAKDDPAAQAVWAAHIERMQTQATQAQAAEPDLRVSDRDPFALRYVALLIALVGLMFGSGYAAVHGSGATPGQVIAAGPTWEGWVRPPAYTRKPNVYLNDVVGQNIVVPEGSEVVLRLYGDVGALTVSETISARTELPGSVTAETQSFSVAQSGRLELRGDGGAIWSITAISDQTPRVQLSARFERSDDDLIQQRFLAQDDYGVVAGRAFVSLHLDEVSRRHGLTTPPMERPPFELQLPLTITGDRTQFEEVLTEDMSQNPWVDLPVQIVLEVEDIRGQTGRSATVETLLPGRRFFDPLAKALIEQRRDILWSPQNAPRIAQVLRAVSLTPEDVFRDMADYTALRGIIDDLEGTGPDLITLEAMDHLAQALWDLAIEVEEGDLADAAAALQRAQDKLAEAIRNGASPTEIQRLMEELRQAQRDYLREFAERNPLDPQEQRDRQNGEGAPEDQDIVSQDQLAEMMQQLQELMEQGRMAEAQELLDEINRLMENLQMSQDPSGQGQQGEGQQAMEGLADTLRQQQDLSDDAFRDLQQGQQGQQGQQPGQQGQQGQGQQPGSDPGQSPGQTPGMSLAERQQMLRDLLDRQRRALPAPGNEAGDLARRSLDEADQSMGRAEQDLRDGDIPGAIDNQAQAMEALREGMRNLGQALAQDQQGQSPTGAQQQAEGTGLQGPEGQIDPLGRNNSGLPDQEGRDGYIPSQEELRRRSEELMDEIQRRGAELDRPEAERGYLERLLDSF